jgi:hypothetical protein
MVTPTMVMSAAATRTSVKMGLVFWLSMISPVITDHHMGRARVASSQAAETSADSLDGMASPRPATVALLAKED